MQRIQICALDRMPRDWKPTSPNFVWYDLQVSYKTDKATLVSLQVPLDCLKDSPSREMKRQKLPTETQDFPHIPLIACFDQFCAEEKIDDYFSASLRRQTKVSCYYYYRHSKMYRKTTSDIL